MKKILFLILIIGLFFIFQNKVNANENGRKGGLRVTPRNAEELRGAIDLREKQFDSSLDSLEEPLIEIVKNQNRFKAGVQNLMIMDGLVDDPDLRSVSEDLNATVERTLEIEKEIVSRSFLKKIFFGQKIKTREDFLIILNKRKEGVEKIQDIYNGCDCNNEIRSIFEKQLNEIKKEQERIELLHKREGEKKGLFPWILSLFK